MKLLRAILTMLTFALTFVIVLAAEYATLAVVVLPGGQSDSVERVELVGDTSHVGYLDAFSFWSDDLKESYAVAAEKPSWSVRGWIGYSWWYDNMPWADIAYSYVKATIVPVVAPMYEIKELYTYYGRELTDIEIKVMGNSSHDYSIGGTPETATFAEAFINGAIIARNGAAEGYWLTPKEYQAVYNVALKILKYNSSVYRKYVEKFINYSLLTEDGLDGDYGIDYEFISVKATSAILYYQYFLALVLAIYFTYQNPIVIKRNENGENEVQGRVFPRIGFGKREHKRKNHKNKDSVGG